MPLGSPHSLYSTRVTSLAEEIVSFRHWQLKAAEQEEALIGQSVRSTPCREIATYRWYDPQRGFKKPTVRLLSQLVPKTPKHNPKKRHSPAYFSVFFRTGKKLTFLHLFFQYLKSKKDNL